MFCSVLWHIALTPANFVFPPSTAKKPAHGSLKREKKASKRSPSYRYYTPSLFSNVVRHFIARTRSKPSLPRRDGLGHEINMMASCCSVYLCTQGMQTRLLILLWCWDVRSDSIGSFAFPEEFSFAGGPDSPGERKLTCWNKHFVWPPFGRTGSPRSVPISISFLKFPTKFHFLKAENGRVPSERFTWKRLCFFFLAVLVFYKQWAIACSIFVFTCQKTNFGSAQNFRHLCSSLPGQQSQFSSFSRESTLNRSCLSLPTFPILAVIFVSRTTHNQLEKNR